MKIPFINCASRLRFSLLLACAFTLLAGITSAQPLIQQESTFNTTQNTTQNAALNAAPASAQQIMAAAKARAAAEHKNVLIIFHASWCGWCKKMDASMADPSCKAYFDKNFVTEHLTVMENGDKVALENPGAQKMLETYGGGESGIPYWLIFSPDGKLLADSKFHSDDPNDKSNGQNMGCPAQPAEVDYFVSVLKKSSQMTDNEAQAVKARFLKNAPSR